MWFFPSTKIRTPPTTFFYERTFPISILLWRNNQEINPCQIVLISHPCECVHLNLHSPVKSLQTRVHLWWVSLNFREESISAPPVKGGYGTSPRSPCEDAPYPPTCEVVPSLCPTVKNISHSTLLWRGDRGFSQPYPPVKGGKGGSKNYINI